MPGTIMTKDVDKLIQAALTEDLGSGDITSEATIPSDATATAEFRAKQDLVLAGIALAQQVFSHLDQKIRLETFAKDGNRISAGTVIACATGKTRALLAGERVALNLLQHLSGIATLTSAYMDRLAGTRAMILDTRKTLPGLRSLQKYAVSVGGGKNHRMGLYDMVLIKDNHITAAGGISRAVGRVREKLQDRFKVEVETKNLAEVREALAAKVDVIMLDNMSLEAMREAVQEIGGRTLVEASGNVTLETVRTIAETGVDFISAGSLTHSAPAADISMKLR